MKALGSSLLAAQRSASSQPSITAVLEDRQGYASRFRLQRVYTGSEAVGPTAAVIAGDGALIRARVDALTDVVYTQRVPSPTAASSFSAWTSHGTGGVGGTVALARSGASIYLFAMHPDGQRIRMKLSTDHGQTYGSFSVVHNAGAAVGFLAAAANAAGEVVLWFSVGATLYSMRYTGAWSTAAAWGHSVASITGVAALYSAGDFQVVVTGTEASTGDAKVWTLVYGDGGALVTDVWGSLLAIEGASAGSTVSFWCPSLANAVEARRLFIVEKRTAAVGRRRVNQSWQHLSNDHSVDRWLEFFPIDYTPADDYGVAAAYGDGNLWLSTPAGVWLGERDSVSVLDVSADVVAATVEFAPDGGRARLELRNDDGRYTGHTSLVRGMRLALSPGYVTESGVETAAPDHFWVESVEWLTGARPRVALNCRDGWWLLERWRARRQYTWPAGAAPLFEELSVVLARAGLLLSGGSASGWTTTWERAFTISPGESGASVVRRVLEGTPDALRFTADGAELLELSASEAAVYAYGDGTGHAILEARYRDNGPRWTRARVLGNAAFDEAIDYRESEAVGERSAPPLRDLNLATDAEVSLRTEMELRRAGLGWYGDEIRVFGVNVGQELYDVVEVTDPQAGLTAAPRRVYGLRWRYETAGRARWEMTLQLGAV